MSPVPTPFEILVLKDCLGVGLLVEVWLPRGPALADLERFAPGLPRTVLHDAPKPFFRIDVPGEFVLTGILGEPRVRFTVRRAQRDHAREIALAAARRLVEGAGG